MPSRWSSSRCAEPRRRTATSPQQVAAIEAPQSAAAPLRFDAITGVGAGDKVLFLEPLDALLQAYCTLVLTGMRQCAIALILALNSCTCSRRASGS